MTRSVLLGQYLHLDEIIWEAAERIDAQGQVTYTAPVTLRGHARLETKFMPGGGLVGTGPLLKTDITVWIPGPLPALPAGQDRLTVDGRAYIVEVVQEVRSFDGALEHLRLQARTE